MFSSSSRCPRGAQRSPSTAQRKPTLWDHPREAVMGLGPFAAARSIYLLLWGICWSRSRQALGKRTWLAGSAASELAVCLGASFQTSYSLCLASTHLNFKTSFAVWTGLTAANNRRASCSRTWRNCKEEDSSTSGTCSRLQSKTRDSPVSISIAISSLHRCASASGFAWFELPLAQHA